MFLRIGNLTMSPSSVKQVKHANKFQISSSRS